MVTYHQNPMLNIEEEMEQETTSLIIFTKGILETMREI
jgi:hypothetical protein